MINKQEISTPLAEPSPKAAAFEIDSLVQPVVNDQLSEQEITLAIDKDELQPSPLDQQKPRIGSTTVKPHVVLATEKEATIPSHNSQKSKEESSDSDESIDVVAKGRRSLSISPLNIEKLAAD